MVNKCGKELRILLDLDKFLTLKNAKIFVFSSLARNFVLSLRQNKKCVKYPLGVQSFGSIRNDGYLYIDKTALVYQIANGGKYYFLSRPRRFGKSLLISTLEAYFLGKKDLFRGLAIDQLEKEWKEYPTLKLSLNVANYTSAKVLNDVLNDATNSWCTQYGITVNGETPSLRFKNLIIALYKKTGSKVVVLVDEYDKPLLQSLDDRELLSQIRGDLKAFYGILKPMDEYVQFGFFTGVTKFSKVSVFSDLNNLTDIAMDQRYVELCGITENEIRTCLDSQVGEMAEANGMSKDECYERLKKTYDGYHFEADTVGIYNPYSLLNALSSKAFKDYWFETGTPSYLIEQLKRTNYPLTNLGTEEITADVLGNIDTIDQSPIPMLYQSGYLTLRSYDKEFEMYHLAFPNLEVERGFTRFLIPYYTQLRSDQGQLFVANFVKELRAGKVEAFMKRLESLFADGDYQVTGNAEFYFQNVVWVIFKMIGFYTEVERHTSDGRIDMIVKTSDYIYILEFKLDKSADEALQQIDDKQYAKPFENDSRHIYKIGVNFSTKTKRIDGWKIAE